MYEPSLLDNIIQEFGEEIGKKINEKLVFESNLYILYLVSIHEVTQRDLEIGFASYHARYPDRTYEQYIKYKKNWDRDRFSFDIEPQGYFIDKATAVDYAESNMGDIRSYFTVFIKNEEAFYIFEFSCETEKYQEYRYNFIDWAKTIVVK